MINDKEKEKVNAQYYWSLAFYFIDSALLCPVAKAPIFISYRSKYKWIGLYS